MTPLAAMNLELHCWPSKHAVYAHVMCDMLCMWTRVGRISLTEWLGLHLHSMISSARRPDGATRKARTDDLKPTFSIKRSSPLGYLILHYPASHNIEFDCFDDRFSNNTIDQFALFLDAVCRSRLWVGRKNEVDNLSASGGAFPFQG